MSNWEWEYKSNPQRWTITVGIWVATVQRVGSVRYLWQASIEHITEPSNRYAGPTDKDAMIGRTWCLRKIAELRAQ